MVYRLLADLVVLVHTAYVAFVVLGLVLVLLGVWLRWRWVRNFWFRTGHLLAIAIVAVESLLGITCPLTTWENDLRSLGGEEETPGSFVGRVLDAVLFWSLPEWVFTLMYCLFALAVAAALVLAPPQWPSRRP